MFQITNSMITIDDTNYQQHVAQEATDGRPKGLMPRNFKSNPVGSYSAVQAFNLKLIPSSEQQGRLDAQKQQQMSGADLREVGMFGARIPSLNQGQKGYCWAHSPVSAMRIMRAMMNQPFADLSAYSVACPIKNFRDEGGWNAESTQYIATNGVATSATWPQQSMDRSCIAASAEERKRYTITKWLDLDPGEMKEQMITVLLSNGILACDYNWWGHSVAIIALLSLNPFEVLCLNSWGETWSQNGAGILKERQAVANASCAIMVAAA